MTLVSFLRDVRYLFSGSLFEFLDVAAVVLNSSYKRVKGRSHTVEKRLNMPPHKPHATSQPPRLSHTNRPRTHSPHNQHSH